MNAAEQAPFTAQSAAHLDQLIRQTRAHHVQLSMMADNKAGILLTVSSVCITLSAPHLSDVRLRWPAAVLMLFCLLTIVMATIAAMPKLGSRERRRAEPDPSSPVFNILFFADFNRLSYDRYLAAMQDAMSCASSTYEAQLREVYTLGLYLQRGKYHWLWLGYLAFVSGLLLSSLVWAVMAFA
jgi:hypothetical protein